MSSECKLTQQQYYSHTKFCMRKEKILLPLWMCCCFFVNSVHHQCRISLGKKSLFFMPSTACFIVVVVVYCCCCWGKKGVNESNHSSMIMREAVIYRLQFSFNWKISIPTRDRRRRGKIWFYRSINFLTVSHWITWLQATHQNIENSMYILNTSHTTYVQYIDSLKKIFSLT